MLGPAASRDSSQSRPGHDISIGGSIGASGAASDIGEEACQKLAWNSSSEAWTAPVAVVQSSGAAAAVSAVAAVDAAKLWRDGLQFVLVAKSTNTRKALGGALSEEGHSVSLFVDAAHLLRALRVSE